MPRHVACGIDFGTSNSTVSVSDSGNKRLVPLEDKKSTLPSALFFQEKSGPLFGRKAIASYTDGENGRFMRGLKKILGTPLMDDTTRIGNRSVPFTEILKTFVSHLKNSAESFVQTPVEHVVLGRPVHFHDDNVAADEKSQATLELIAKQAGFNHVEFLYEPIAAAFAHEENVADEKLSLVADLGGGTSDFTVIRISQKKMQNKDRKDDILSTSGVRIGGTTFDYRLSLKNFMPELGLGTQYHDLFDKKKLLPIPTSVYFQLSDWALVNFAQTSKAIAETLDLKKRALDPMRLDYLLKLQQNHYGHALLGIVEDTKISLTEKEQYAALLKIIDPDLSCMVTRQNFEEAIEQDVSRIFKSIDECLLRAGITPEQIDLIILTGGSTELPIINRIVRKTFPHADISQSNKLDSVGLGLAYRAANIF